MSRRIIQTRSGKCSWIHVQWRSSYLSRRIKQDNHRASTEFNENKSSLDFQPKRSNSIFLGNTVSLNTSELSEINVEVTESLEPLDGGHLRCRICGKDSTGMKGSLKGQLKANMKNHVETHLEGLSYPCQLCGKEFRSKQSLADHKRRKCSIHKN